MLAKTLLSQNPPHNSQFTIHNSQFTTQPLSVSLSALQYRNRKAPSMAFGRSVIRSSTTVFRNAASRVATTEAKAVRSQPFSFPKQNSPLSACIFRSPVELSCCVESLMPLHTATSSALLTSMLSISRRSCLPQACNDDV